MEQEKSTQGTLPAVEQLDASRTKHLSHGDEPTTWITPFKLTIVMACHNEVETIGAAISSVLSLRSRFDLELIVVDDGCTDGSGAVIDRVSDSRFIVLRNRLRCGKGAALRRAAAVATGTHLLVFDADLEYAASDIPNVVEPVLDGIASVVYGTRIPGMRTTFPSFRYALGSKVTTVAANILFDAWMSDMHTCLKLIPLRLFRELHLSEAGFGLDTEITGELLRRGIRPYEVPCSYRGRTIAQGKKISARDGLACLVVLARVRARGLTGWNAPSVDGLRVLHGMSSTSDLEGGVATEASQLIAPPPRRRGIEGSRPIVRPYWQDRQHVGAAGEGRW